MKKTSVTYLLYNYVVSASTASIAYIDKRTIRKVGSQRAVQVCICLNGGLDCTFGRQSNLKLKKIVSVAVSTCICLGGEQTVVELQIRHCVECVNFSHAWFIVLRK